jgi:dUTP pyrophosphatase
MQSSERPSADVEVAQPVNAQQAVFIKVQRLDPGVPLPTYASAGAACVDLHAVCEHPKTLFRGETHVFGTGLKLQFPQGYGLLIFCRSGLAFKHHIHLANNVAVIDSDFRGEIKLKLVREFVMDGADAPITIKPYDRIAQAMLVPLPQMVLVEVDRLDDTDRGTGGLGSTGVAALDVPIPTPNADRYVSNVRQALDDLARDEDPSNSTAGRQQPAQD